jgi:hypothetical protein
MANSKRKIDRRLRNLFKLAAESRPYYHGRPATPVIAGVLLHQAAALRHWTHRGAGGLLLLQGLLLGRPRRPGRSEQPRLDGRGPRSALLQSLPAPSGPSRHPPWPPEDPPRQGTRRGLLAAPAHRREHRPAAYPQSTSHSRPPTAPASPAPSRSKPCDFRYATLNFKIPAPPRSTFRANPALFDYQSGSPSITIAKRLIPAEQIPYSGLQYDRTMMFCRAAAHRIQHPISNCGIIRVR